jgi:hypothetical protein
VNIIEVSTGNKLTGQFSQLQDSKGFKRELKKNFSFDWEEEFANEVYGIYLPKEKSIIGLMSISNIEAEYRIHLNLIESSIVNRGKSKKIQNIPHCLISFACKLAFGFGYDGFVSLYPKTSLIDYYINEYGFQQFGRHLAIYGDNSFKLIKQYLDE